MHHKLAWEPEESKTVQGNGDGSSSRKTIAYTRAPMADPLDGQLRNPEKGRSEAPIEMRSGMRKLLELHNADELRILCKRFGIEGRLTKNQKIKRIFEKVLTGGEQSYRDCLGLVWEGLLMEYLRSVGRRVRSHTLDPKVCCSECVANPSRNVCKLKVVSRAIYF